MSRINVDAGLASLYDEARLSKNTELAFEILQVMAGHEKVPYTTGMRATEIQCHIDQDRIEFLGRVIEGLKCGSYSFAEDRGCLKVGRVIRD